MRSHEERVAAVRRRIAEIERQKRLRRARIGVGLAVAASLVLIIGASYFMPGIVGQMVGTEDYSNYDMAASMFSGMVFGYAVIALLAFVLGVCVTILCYRIHLIHQEDNSDGRTD